MTPFGRVSVDSAGLRLTERCNVFSENDQSGRDKPGGEPTANRAEILAEILVCCQENKIYRALRLESWRKAKKLRKRL
jgi:hypothetical protein